LQDNERRNEEPIATAVSRISALEQIVIKLDTKLIVLEGKMNSLEEEHKTVKENYSKDTMELQEANQNERNKTDARISELETMLKMLLQQIPSRKD